MAFSFGNSKSADSSKITKATGAVLDSPASSSSQSSLAPPAVGARTVAAKQPQQGSKASQERRRQKRARVKLSARIGPADLAPGQCCEIIATVNASRQNLYFVTESETYHLGMRLRVNFPFDAAHDDSAASHEYGEIVRTERLADNRIGVAVQMGKPAQAARQVVNETVKPANSSARVEERRATERQPFLAEAVVVDLYGSMRVQSRCSDLSLQGCYVDTLNPFAAGTLVRVELRTSEKEFEAIALVNSSHSGMGMGLHFQDLRPEQTSVLTHWLTSEPSGRMWVGSSANNPKKKESSDRTLAIEIVRDMIAKGILTKADISDIFFNPGTV